MRPPAAAELGKAKRRPVHPGEEADVAAVSRNCKDEYCTACTGCDHDCHLVPPPIPLRELRDRERARNASTSQPKEAKP
jgi:hypothetical protein